MRIVDTIVAPFHNFAAWLRAVRSRARAAWRDLLVELMSEPQSEEARRWREIRHTIAGTIWRVAAAAAVLMALSRWLR